VASHFFVLRTVINHFFELRTRFRGKGRVEKVPSEGGVRATPPDTCLSALILDSNISCRYVDPCRLKNNRQSNFPGSPV
jgi:hypothetical protein